MRLFDPKRITPSARTFYLIVLVLAVVFLVAMVVAPAIQSGCDWSYIQQVWDRWQTFNAAMVAFIATFIGFQISKSIAEDQRKREFQAAKAFLPMALSELTTYFKMCATMLLTAAKSLEKSGLEELNEAQTVPELPSNPLRVFKECIQLAEPEVAQHLSELLAHLQVHGSRIASFAKQTNQLNGPNLCIDFRTISTSMFDLGKLLVYVNGVFPFARGQKNSVEAPLTDTNFATAYFALGLTELGTLEQHLDLENYTKDLLKGNGHDQQPAN